MIVLNVTFMVKPESKEEFFATLNPLIEGTRTEDGNLLYELHVSLEDEFKFVLVEHFADQEAVDIHNESEHFKKYAPKLGDFCSEITAQKLVLAD